MLRAQSKISLSYKLADGELYDEIWLTLFMNTAQIQFVLSYIWFNVELK